MCSVGCIKMLDAFDLFSVNLVSAGSPSAKHHSGILGKKRLKSTLPSISDSAARDHCSVSRVELKSSRAFWYSLRWKQVCPPS